MCIFQSSIFIRTNSPSSNTKLQGAIGVFNFVNFKMFGVKSDPFRLYYILSTREHTRIIISTLAP